MKTINMINSIFIMTLALGLAACAPTNSFQSSNNDDTGHTKIIRDADTHDRVKAHYTISGSKASFARLSKEIGDRTDSLLAQSVKDASAQLTAPTKMTVRVQFEQTSISTPTDITLHANLVASSGGLRANEVVQDNPQASYFIAYIFCPQTNCKRVEIRLQNRTQTSNKSTDQATAKNEVGILVTNSTPVVQLMERRDKTPYVSPSFRSLESALPDARAGTIHANQKAVVVVDGPSFAQVWLAASGTAPASFSIAADLFDTSTVISEINVASINGRNVRGRLVGNDSSRGDLMVEFVDKNESALLQIEKDQNDLDPEDKEEPDEISYRSQGPDMEAGKAVFPVHSSDPLVKSASEDLADYSKHPSTVEQINWLLKNDPKGLKGFFKNAPNVSPIIGSILESVRVSPEFAYVLPVESPYLKDGTFYSTQVTLIRTNPGNSAFGPWQIINRTALGIKQNSGEAFNYIPVKNMKWDDKDDRGYLVQSTYMAALHMNELVRGFPQDKALAILAYHAGAPTVKNGVEALALKEQNALRSRMKNISPYKNITLAKVAKKKMVGNDSLKYVFRVLAWKEIGQNPTKYGFGNIKPVPNDKFRARLSRPNGPIPSAFAKAQMI